MITEITNFIKNNIKSKLNKENEYLVNTVRDKVNEKYQIVIDLNKIKKILKLYIMCKLKIHLQDVPYPYCLAINECVICDGNDMNCNNFKEYNKKINRDEAGGNTKVYKKMINKVEL